VGGLFYRLDLLVLLGRHRDGGRGGDHRLRAVLVPGLSDWVASLAVILLLLSLNLATVKMFGEMEFWFAMIKIVAIVALIVVGLVMVMMHFKSPTGVEASLPICGMTAAGSRKAQRLLCRLPDCGVCLRGD
jgi:D-serine/D-alanine/glycine transporter